MIFLLKQLYNIKGIMAYDRDAVEALNTCIKIIESKPQRLACKVDYDERFRYNMSEDEFEHYINRELTHHIADYINSIMKPKTYNGVFAHYKYVDFWIGGLDEEEPKIYPLDNGPQEWCSIEEMDLRGGWRNE